MEKTKKLNKIKIILVIAFIVLFAAYSYMSCRANYLQILEIGEEYLNVFEQKNNYKIRMFVFSFIILYIIVSITNASIKKGLKPFFDDDKKQIPKLPNKSLAFVISIIGSGVFTSALLEKTMLFINSTWFRCK